MLTPSQGLSMEQSGAKLQAKDRQSGGAARLAERCGARSAGVASLLRCGAITQPGPPRRYSRGSSLSRTRRPKPRRHDELTG